MGRNKIDRRDAEDAEKKLRNGTQMTLITQMNADKKRLDQFFVLSAFICVHLSHL